MSTCIYTIYDISQARHKKNFRVCDRAVQPQRLEAWNFGFVKLCLFVLRFNVQVNKFSVMLGQSPHFLCITSTFGEKSVLLKDTIGGGR